MSATPTEWAMTNAKGDTLHLISGIDPDKPIVRTDRGDTLTLNQLKAVKKVFGDKWSLGVAQAIHLATEVEDDQDHAQQIQDKIQLKAAIRYRMSADKYSDDVVQSVAIDLYEAGITADQVASAPPEGVAAIRLGLETYHAADRARSGDNDGPPASGHC